MAGRYLLDTNAVIALFKDTDAKLLKDLLVQSEEIFLSTIVIGELCFGARKSHRTEENLTRIQHLAAECTILDCTVAVAQQYGIVKRDLRQVGRPIPDNDTWIAATAVAYQLTLIVRDQHFDEILSLMTVGF